MSRAVDLLQRFHYRSSERGMPNTHFPIELHLHDMFGVSWIMAISHRCSLHEYAELLQRSRSGEKPEFHQLVSESPQPHQTGISSGPPCCQDASKLMERKWVVADSMRGDHGEADFDGSHDQ